MRYTHARPVVLSCIHRGSKSTHADVTVVDPGKSCLSLYREGGRTFLVEAAPDKPFCSTNKRTNAIIIAILYMSVALRGLRR